MRELMNGTASTAELRYQMAKTATATPQSASVARARDGRTEVLRAEGDCAEVPLRPSKPFAPPGEEENVPRFERLQTGLPLERLDRTPRQKDGIVVELASVDGKLCQRIERVVLDDCNQP